MSFTSSLYFQPTGSVAHSYQVVPLFYPLMGWQPPTVTGSIQVPVVGQLWPRGNFSS